MSHLIWINWSRKPLISDKKIEYWRSLTKYEIDFLIYDNLSNIVAIEVKSGTNPSAKDFKGFKAFEEEFKLKK